MITNFRKITELFNQKQKNFFFIILIGSILASVFEVFGIFSVGPFIAMVTDSSIIENNKHISFLYKYLNFSNEKYFIFAYGIFSLLLIIFSNLFFLAMLIITLRFSATNAIYLENKLLANYLYQPYSFFLKTNSSGLTKNILSEVGRVSGGIVTPFINFISKLIIICVITISLFFINHKYTLCIFFIFLFTYLSIYLFVKKKIKTQGNLSEESNLKRYNLLNKAFSFFKILKITNTENFFTDNYKIPSNNFNKSNAKSLILSQSPRYIIEMVAVSIIIVMILSLLYTGSTKSALAIVSVYAFAGLRLLPAFQEVYRCYNLIKFYQPSLNKVLADLYLSKSIENKKNSSKIMKFDRIKLKNISFTYENQNIPTLDDINLEILRGDRIGLIGETGCGKTTLVDIMSGLLKPNSGTITVNDIDMTEINNEWKENIGYVPQNPFLIEGSIVSNIAYGYQENKIDLVKIQTVSELAQINNFIVSLPEKYYSQVGERGVRLSGGQIQRLAIARALYRDPKILILDEATSALDSDNEKKILDSLVSVSKDITIIMITHKIETLKHCSKIFTIKNKKLFLNEKNSIS